MIAAILMLYWYIGNSNTIIVNGKFFSAYYKASYIAISYKLWLINHMHALWHV